MSISDDDAGWSEIDEGDLPDLISEEGRDAWAEILLAQDDETLAKNESNWVKALTVADENGNMVARFVYPDGNEEVFDLIIRRTIAGNVSDADERN